ncbi:Bro-N domain-containing protein [Glaesserella parasuis]|nr:Bro-N domain-containing protein [Glaesserella parasuis]
MSNHISTFNFKSQPIRIQSLNDEPYFCLTDVCSVLGVNRRSSEAFRLNEKGCSKIAVLTEGGMQEVVFINEPNLYRIIFRSNKSQAIEFQNWVFEEVLPQIRKTGQYSVQPQPLALPEPEKKYTFEFTEDDLLDLTWAWFAFIRGIHTFRAIYTPLNALGSNYSAMVYGQGYEYATTARNAHKVIQRLTKDIAYDYTSNWRVLKHVREFDPTFKKSIL